MPQIELSMRVTLPASLVGPEVARILRDIEKGEPPFSNFGLSADLRAVHLPSIGALSVPIALQVGSVRDHGMQIDFGFSAKDSKALFPMFVGSLRSDAEGPFRSTVCLLGEYSPRLDIPGASWIKQSSARSRCRP